MAPLLFMGSWDERAKDMILAHARGTSTIASHIREGIVIRPMIERWDAKVGRVVLKRINEKYLLKDYGDDH